MQSIITRLYAALVPLLATDFIASTPLAAPAQSAQRGAAQIDNFQVDLSDQFAPGSEIEFTLEGTPRGQASVRLTGVKKLITLTEMDPGVYEGSYTIRRMDNFAPSRPIVATLRIADRVVTQAIFFERFFQIR